MSSNWWNQKLGAPSDTPAPYTPQQPATPMATPQPATYAPPAQQYPPQQQMTPPAPTCPSCRSGNYVSVGQQVTQNGAVATYRCYDCGYPVVQAGSGLKGVSGQGAAGPARPSRQVQAGGWNPTTIIGRLE